MKLPAYPRTKPSAVEWVGDVPEHWTVKPLRYLSGIRKGRLPGETFPAPMADGDQPYLSMEYLRGETDSPTYVAPSSSLVYAESGDILLLWDGSNAGEFLRAKTGVVSSTVARFEPRTISKNFLFFACKAVEPQIKDQTVGMGIPHVSGDELKSCSFPFPESAEQQAIATYLDRETGRLDRLVGRKQELIERLKEKRTALISRTVTRGLPPAAARAAGLPANPPLKPSGTEWLGDIPAHWEVKKGRYVGILFGSISPSEDEFVEDDSVQNGDLPFAKVDDLNQIDGSLKLVTTKARVRGCRARQGAFLLFPKRGAAIFTNKVAIAEQPLLFDPNLMGWQINSSFAVKFVAYCLIARRLDDLADVSTVPQINNKHIYPAAFPRPPLPEQTAIAAYLDLETAVERLQEYRTALITAAVTGKIDVRANSKTTTITP